jgi:hypothetical protein
VNQDGESEVSQLEFDRRLVERLERLYATRDVADDAVGAPRHLAPRDGA